MNASLCPRCGAPMLSLEQLAQVALEADRALETMRLVLPDALTAGVRVLAASLKCHARNCKAKGGR